MWRKSSGHHDPCPHAAVTVYSEVADPQRAETTTKVQLHRDGFSPPHCPFVGRSLVAAVMCRKANTLQQHPHYHIPARTQPGMMQPSLRVSQQAPLLCLWRALDDCPWQGVKFVTLHSAPMPARAIIWMIDSITNGPFTLRRTFCNSERYLAFNGMILPGNISIALLLWICSKKSNFWH